MKKLICLLFLLPLWGGASVVNGNFEQVAEGLPANWRHGSHDGGEYTFAAGEEGENRFFRISGAKPGGRAFIEQSARMAAGNNDVLKVSFRFRGKAPVLDGFVRVYLGADQMAQYWWRVDTVGEGWQQHDAYFALPAGVRGKEIRLQSILYLRGQGVADYDDYSLTLLRRSSLPAAIAAQVQDNAPEPPRAPASTEAAVTRFVDDFQTLENGLPKGWRTGSHDGGDYVFSVAQEGSEKAFRIEGRAAGGRAFIERHVPFVRGEYSALKVSFRYRGTAPAADGFVRIFADNKEVGTFPWKLTDVQQGWQRFERIFVLPGAELKGRNLRLQSILYLRGLGTIDYDDYSLELLNRSQMSAEQVRAATPDWSHVTDSYALRFLPADKLVSQLNPPAFSWPFLPSVNYDFELADSEDFAAPVLVENGLAQNILNLDAELEAKTYWWRVRPVAGELKGQWSDARRVRIDEDAIAFPIAPIEVLRDQVSRSHPRIWFTPENLPQMRQKALGERSEWFNGVRDSMDRIMVRPLPPEPTFAFSMSDPRTAEWITAHNLLRTAGERPAGEVSRMAFVYLMTGDRRYGERAVQMLMNIAGWDPEGATSFSTHDQVHRRIAFESAIAYDWLYDLLTPEQRKTVLDMVRKRTDMMFVSLIGGATSMDRRPYNSHNWTAFGYTGLISLALLHDEPRAAQWFDTILPWYINLHPLWAGQDGGWFQGNGYWRYTQESSALFQDALRTAVGLDFYRKPFSYNSGLFPIYNMPYGTKRSHFGDENRVTPDHYHATHMARMANYWQDPVLQWGAMAIGEFTGYGINPLYNVDESLEPKLPASLPPSRWFEDTGWAALHSDLVDPERVSLYFKSSWIGSYNHSHADQNSFVLSAFGEPLLIDTGYYDWYHSPHDKNYARHTLAHNAITVNGGYGQSIDNINAKGEILGFVYGGELDAVSGDASVAYGKRLEKAVRHIIYLRPEVFVVIDELEAPQGSPVPFEWWFHSLAPMQFGPDGRSALVSSGRARLQLDVVSGSPVGVEQRDAFIGPPDVYAEGEPHTPFRPQQRGARWPDQSHGAFVFAAQQRAVIVTVLSAYREGEQPVAFTTQQEKDFLRIDFADGRSVWVRTDTSAETVGDADVSFNAAAFARTPAGWLLVDGLGATLGGQTLLEASAPVWVSADALALSICSADDAELEVTLAHKPEALVDGKGRAYAGWRTQRGAGGANVLRFANEAGFNRYYTDASQIPALAQVGSAPFELVVEGRPHGITLQTMQGADGQTKAWGLLGVPAGTYVVSEMSDGMTLSGHNIQPDVIRLNNYAALTLSGDPAGKVLKLAPVEQLGTLSAVPVGEAVSSTAAMSGTGEQPASLASAVSAASASPASASRSGLRREAEDISHRQSYRVNEYVNESASGGSFVEISPWHPVPMPGVESRIGWVFDVEEDGEYRIVMKIALDNPEQEFAFEAGAFAFTLSGIPVAADVEAGAGGRRWQLVSIDRPLPLKRGRVQVLLSQQNGQSAALDYLELIPVGTAEPVR